MSTRSQQGVALIAVLFVVVMLTLLLSQLLTQNRQDSERTTWLTRQAQAYQYALGGELVARQLLHESSQKTASNAEPSIIIMGQPRHYQPEHGDIWVTISDLQGRLNLNNLNQGSHRESIRRYLAQIDPSSTLAARLSDWLDADGTPGPGGAEDSTYLSLEQPFRAAGRRMTDSSELRLLMDSLDVPDVLFPWLTALPTPTPLNIKTLLPELAPLIHPQLSSAQLASMQSGNGFSSIETLSQSSMMAGLSLDPSAISVDSSYYEVAVWARFDDWHQPLVSRLFVNQTTGMIRLLDRTLIADSETHSLMDDLSRLTQDLERDTNTAL